MIRLSLATSVAALALSTAAFAQDAGSDLDFDGPYVGLSGGYTVQGNDTDSSIIFDTNRDGTFGENVNTVAGANAFSPSFCNGAATSSAPTNCTNDTRLSDVQRNRRNPRLGISGASARRDSDNAYSLTRANTTKRAPRIG